jgi:hypothetical protein
MNWSTVLNLNLALIATVSISVSAFASRGGMEGGGGKGVRCGNVVSLLDLYEGQLAGYPAPITSGGFDQDLRTYIFKISRQLSTPGIDVNAPGYLDKVMSKTYGLLGQVNDIPNGQTLTFTNDATLPKIPADCSFVQVAVNIVSESNSGVDIVVYRDKVLWELMPEIDRVALIIHEYTYWMTRIFGETSSDDTRKLVARMFSGLETYEMFSPIWNAAPIISCWGNNSSGTQSWEIFAAQEADHGVSGVGFYFRSITGKFKTSRTHAFFAGLKPNDLLAGNSVSAFAIATNELLKERWSLAIQSGPNSELKLKIGNQPFLNGLCRLN